MSHSSISSPALSVRNLRIALPPGSERHYAVNNISLDIAAGEVVCLIGESGSGKSMIAQTIMGLTPPNIAVSQGRILMHGESVLDMPPKRIRALRGNRIAMVFQEPLSSFDPLQRIGDQIGLPLKLHTRLSRIERYDKVIGLMEKVGLPDPVNLYRRYPHELSGGQLQRALIAAALTMNPDVLIADEPTTALDATTQAQIIELLLTCRREFNMGILFISHDLSVVAKIADRILVMRHGEVLENDVAQHVLSNPQHPYTRELLAAAPVLVLDGHRSLIASEQAVALSVQSIDKAYRSGSIWRRSLPVPILKDVSLNIAHGQILGVIGESGSGKSTLARCIAKLLEIDHGKIEIAGQDIGHLKGERLRLHRKQVQMVFQDPYKSFNPRFTIGEALIECAVNLGADKKTASRKAVDLLMLVGLKPDMMQRFPHEFSGGQRQRISIARALMVDPALLIADEAVSALDISIQAQIIRLLRDVRQKLGLTILFITHDLRVASGLCDQIVVMHQGRVVEAGATSDVFSNPQHHYTQHLLSSATLQ
jgi:peptide/nickel transport system ATP-binding protein